VLSLQLIHEVSPTGAVIDVGGGASPLAGRLLDAGYAVAVVDISAAALDRAKGRLGPLADQVGWIVADVTAVADVGRFNVWHDRAAFHFLARRDDRQRYVGLLGRTVPPGGHAVIATFALDGPSQCSGLDVVRYDGELLARELGDEFELLRSVPETHVAPSGKPQSFQYSVFRHRPAREAGV
jgi:SAM-dependent methyltransferase